MTSMYTNFTSLQKVESSTMTSYYSFKHAAHMRNLHLHDHSEEAELLIVTIILNPQYMSPNVSEEPLQYYFALGALVIQEVHSTYI